MNMMNNWIWTLGLVGLVLAGCAETAGPADASSEEDNLIGIGGKFDTGYYSSLATELEGDFKATLELDVTLLDAEERDKLQGQTVLRLIAERQVKMAKNQLNEKSLHLNLTAGEVTFESKVIEEREDGHFLVAKYSVLTESLVTYEELEAEGINPSDLEDTSYSVIVPADPRDMYDRAHEACAGGFEPGSLKETNYFYYFEPTKSGCPIAMVDDAVFHVRSLLPQTETFPEYDRLTADGTVEAAIVFGAYSDDYPSDSDWGVMMWRTYAVNLRLSGWTEVDELVVGQRYRRERADLMEVIDLYSPMDLFELEDTNATFGELLYTQEIVAYNGHSFYGSLSVLNEGDYYPEDTYQILFMNSCWSYEYYTKQVFTHKATEEDPEGWLDVDVVNNTTYAYFPQMATSTSKLITNLFVGAETGGIDPLGRRFSWQSIIGLLNDEARGVCPWDADPMDCRHYQPKSAHEVYGVSGVRTNVFTPRL